MTVKKLSYVVRPGYVFHVRAHGLEDWRITADWNGHPVQGVIDRCDACGRYSTARIEVHTLEEAAERGWIEFI